MKWARLSKETAPYVFVSPFFVVFIIFWVGPIAASMYYSLTNWSASAIHQFVGFRNYIAIFQDPRFLTALRNTFWFAAVYVVIMVSLATLTALLVHSLPGGRLKSFLRSTYFAPVTVSMAAVAVIFDLIFSRDIGLLNEILKFLGLPGNYNWLGSSDLSMWSIVILKVWRAFGYYATIVMAGLQAIPEELFEAAEIDGANRFQQFCRVTLPLLRPVMAFVVVMSTIWALETFDEPWILLKGGPSDSTLTVVIYLYQHGFQFLQLGYSAAVAYVLAFLSIVISLLQRRLIDHD